MFKRFVFFVFFSCVISSCEKSNKIEKKPKLIVGIVVDQMRYDYISRFYDRFGEGGFKKLLKNGYFLENAHFNYIPTYTAVGHASIFTGTTPNNHGIISNNWYDKFLKKSIYCVDDFNYNTVGNNSKEGKKSPNRMFTTTITDELHLAQNSKGKTIGIAIKDRSSILPAGHTANAAYWFHGGNKGDWITSSYYMDELPKWVIDFNNSNKVDSLLKNPWKTLYNIETYKNSFVDNNDYEGKFYGEETTTFPHNIPDILSKTKNKSIIKQIPAGNTITKDFAKKAISSENLGQSEYTDFLTLSFSSTDYVGHKFGPHSIEIEDTYLRLDKDLEDFLTFLDNEVGINNYTLFLTADHGVVNVPSYLQSLKIPAHYLNINDFKDYISEITKKYFNSDDLIENISNYQIFLNKEKIEKLNLSKNIVAEKLVDEVVNFDGIYKAVSAKTLQSNSFDNSVLSSLQNGYNQKLSGDILLIPYPATLIGNKTGTSHGTGYNYDTHVPIIFYGNGIKNGTSKEKYNIIDIAPTIASLLKIEASNSATGKIITEALK